jgi:uncharacterized protein
MIKFRPHHFLCALGFQGKGYSDAFIENFSRIMEHLNGPYGDTHLIEVVEEADSVCEPCPERRGTLCTEQGKIARLDDEHRRVLDLKGGDRLSWGDAKERIASNIDIQTFEHICRECSWKDLGYCRTALIELRTPT